MIITINSHAGKLSAWTFASSLGLAGRKHTNVRHLSIPTPFHFPLIFQLRAPSNLLSAAAPAR